MTDLSHSREKDKINPVVFYTSAGLILLFSLTTILFRDFSALWIGRTLDWVSKTFGWYYLLAATLYIVFVVCIACSRFGSVKLGPEQSKPEFSLLSWAAMLFAAGIGIDLMFFSVAEPVTQYMQPPEGAGQTIEAARQAMVWPLFHYGLTGWSMYALMGMALGYFSYRYNLPLTIRSALYPIFGKRINGPIGHSVDIAAVIGTIFGIATTLGIGVVQLNYGLSVLFDIPDSMAAKAALIALSVIIATISVTSGVDKGIRVLSELNVALALGLILFVLFMGDTSFLLNALVLNVGDYVNRFMGMTLNSFAFDRPVEWMNNWTLFFWAWWVAWSPFVGLFLARISRGRTIRQFVLGTLIIPFTFTLLWLSVFGNSALYEIIHGGAAFAEEAMVHPERGFYSRLAQYPAFSFSASVATITGLRVDVASHPPSRKPRLSRLPNYPATRYTKQMMETVCYPAMEEVAQELRLRGAYVELKSLPPEEGQQLGHLDLLVHMGEEQNFVYQIWPQQYSVPGFTYRARSGKSTYYRLETFLLEGSQGNDLMDYSKEQVITDILDQYERHLNFIHLHREAPGHSVMFPDA